MLIMNKPKVGILLVITNEEKYIPLFVKTLLKQEYENYTLYALNNNCTDNSIPILRKLFPNCKIYGHSETTGFAKGNNILAKAAIEDGCNFLFVLNPDIELGVNCISNLVLLIESDKNIGAVAPIMFYGNEKRDLNIIQAYSKHINFTNRKITTDYANEFYSKINAPKVIDVNIIPGGITFIRTNVVKEIGLFDERYHIYGEEADLAKRFDEKKYTMKVTSRAKVWHHHTYSKKNKQKYYFEYYYNKRNGILYFHKYKMFSKIFNILLKEFLLIPQKIRWALKIADIKLLKYYYLGLMHGLLNKKGKAKLNF